MKPANQLLRSGAVLLLLVLAVACGSTGGGEDDLAGKQKELDKSRKELADLKQKIAKLEEEIKEMNGGETDVVRKPVRIDTISLTNYQHPVEIQGTVESKGNITVSAEAGGVLKSIPVDEGQQVSKGQLIAKLDDAILQNSLKELQKAYELAEVTFNKQKNLWEQNIGSEIDFLRAKNQKESLEQQIITVESRIAQSQVRAPISGTVDELFVNEGELVSPGRPVIRLVDTRNVEITADVSEKYLGVFKRGDSVSVRFPAVGETLKGNIKAVGNVINEANRTFKLTIDLAGQRPWLKPNLLAMITAHDKEYHQALVVPTRLLHQQLNGQYIYIAEEVDSVWQAVKRPVKLVQSYPDVTVIKSGIEPGQLLITQGYSNISEGERLEVINK